jgi:hypothetical protein
VHGGGEHPLPVLHLLGVGCGVLLSAWRRRLGRRRWPLRRWVCPQQAQEVVGHLAVCRPSLWVCGPGRS